MKTFSATEKTVERRWYVINAADQILGRLACELARRLRGKHKPEYTPHVDTGDYLVVLNAGAIRVTGKKLEKKQYIRHTGYIGGLKQICLKKLLDKYPERALAHAVRGMLPKGPLGRMMFKKLRLFSGSTHTHQAQCPLPLVL